jgi:glycosyltransferase involved in cell wall biosynthesis
MTASQPELLYYCPASIGGIADYAHFQVVALAGLGVRVTLLCPTDWPHTGETGYAVRPSLLPSVGAKNLPRWQSRFRISRAIMLNQTRLAATVRHEGFRRVLCATYSEYLAPLWAPKLGRLAADGVVFGSIIHDPVRDFIVGPKWWHRWSVACGYSFLREAFVHDDITLDTVQSMPRLHTTVIPHGTYSFPQPDTKRAKTRAELGIPESATLMLSFGHIRDGKNLDLVLRAMAQFPNFYLLVAGKEGSSGQRPVSFYQTLASQLGVADRCRWLVRFIAEREVGNLFVASDLTLLMYSKVFRSASGVLNAAVFYRTRCLASSGPGGLRSSVEKYDLGVWVEPDAVGAIVDGLRQLQANDINPRWRAYERENSWERNAMLVKERMFSAA